MAGSYRDLVVWQRAMDFCVVIYEATERFPKSETYGLTQQMRKASVSVPSNIAEGHGRKTARQRFKFLEDSLGSTFELETQIELATRLKYIDEATGKHFSEAIAQIGRGLTGLMKHVEREARAQPTTRHQ